MMLTWKVLLFLNIVLYFLLVIRFNKTKYFFYFLFLSLVDPLYILLHYLFRVSSYHYMPIVLPISLFFVPSNEKKHIFVSIITIFFLLPYFRVVNILPPLITTIASIYLIYFFTDELMNEYKKSSSVILFIPIMILNILKDNFKIYLYYMHNDILIKYFTWFLVVGAVVPAAMAYFGQKQIKPRFNSNRRSTTLLNPSVKTMFNFNYLPHDPTMCNLSNSELRVLAFLAQGFKSNEIAEKLCIDRRTVYFHSQNIKNKLNIDSSLRLAKFAIENREYLLNSIKPAHFDNISPKKLSF